MVSLTTHELRLIAEKRNIKDYRKMSREELLKLLMNQSVFSKWTGATCKNTESFKK